MRLNFKLYNPLLTAIFVENFLLQYFFREIINVCSLWMRDVSSDKHASTLIAPPQRTFILKKIIDNLILLVWKFSPINECKLRNKRIKLIFLLVNDSQWTTPSLFIDFHSVNLLNILMTAPAQLFQRNSISLVLKFRSIMIVYWNCNREFPCEYLSNHHWYGNRINDGRIAEYLMLNGVRD